MTIDNGTIQLGPGGGLPSNTSVNLYGATTGFTSAGYATGVTPGGNGLGADAQNGTLDLGGYNQTVFGLSGFTGTGGGAYGVVTDSQPRWPTARF